MKDEHSSPFEMAAVVCLGLFFVLASTVWAGAVLSAKATGHVLKVGLPEAAAAMLKLPSTMSEPAKAWPEALRSDVAGPVVYWSATGLLAAAVLALVGLCFRWWARRRKFGLEPRKRLGVDTEARFANRRDLAPLVVPGPVPGRLILGRVDRALIATESRGAPPVGGPMQRRRAAARSGNRGGVALLGPSQCGKTTAAISGILDWTGPAVLSSVKFDLLLDTIEHRRRMGEVKVFAPTRQMTAKWSPLRNAQSFDGAQQAAKALCDACPKSGIDGGSDYWIHLSEMLLTSLLWVATNSGGTMADVCSWVMTQDRRFSKKDPGRVWPRLDRLLKSTDPDVVDGAERSSEAISGIWQSDDKLRGSIYMTATGAVWPWMSPAVESSATCNEIDLDWLLNGSNTLYLAGPLKDQLRFAAAYGGLLGDLMDQVFDRVDRTGKPLEHPLLFVMDEAGNTPIKDLPQWASVVAGLGVQLVTIWQSKGQIDAIYGQQNADTILTNHLTKVGFAGLSDRSSLDYFTYLLGDEQVASRVLSNDWRGSAGRSVSESTSLHPLAPPHVIRQQPPGHAVMIHGTLPPAHLESIDFRKG